MIQALRVLRDRNDVVALVTILLVVQFFFPKGVPAGIYGLGLVGGGALLLHAVAIVLVYRSNRIINFAQVQIGAVAATLFTVLTKYFPLIRLLKGVCPPCAEGVSFEDGTPAVTGLLYDVNYYLSLVVSFGFALLLGYGIYRLVVRRFEHAPRLILTVATIFLAQGLALFQALFPILLTTEIQREGAFDLGPAPIPFQFTMRWEPAQFNAPDILTVVVALVAIAGLLVYFRMSSTGVAIRAAAENPSRIETLGVNVHKVTSRVWVFVAALSAFAGIFEAMSAGATGTTSLSVSQMVRILAVAVIARMVSLPMTALAAFVFGILDQSVLWSFGSLAALDGLLLVIVGAILMLQRHTVSRAEIEQASTWQSAREIRPTPRELAALPSVKRWHRIGWTALGLLALGAPWALSPAQTNLLSVVAIYMLIALSLLVLTGWAGQISLGQFAFAAIGGYVVAVWGAPFFIAVVVAALVAAIAGVVVGLPALKMRGLHLAITTMAFALSVTALLLNPRYFGDSLPSTMSRPVMLGMDFEDERTYYYLVLVFLVAVTAGVLGVRRSRTARALIASRDNEPAAQSFGINLVRARLGASALSGFIAGLAGALFAYHQHGVKSQAYSPEVSVLVFTIAVIGGLGSVPSVLVGAGFYGLLVLFDVGNLLTLAFTGWGGLLVLMFLRGGLGQALFNVRDSMLRRLASREGIVVPSLVADVRAEALETPRAPIEPKMRPGGGQVFVPARYRLSDQWALEEVPREPVNRDRAAEKARG